jgi:D-serine deaminase-like pyridoxal phosphate-dependent protein
MNPPAKIGMPLAQVDTPALILDLDVFEQNLALMNAAVKGHGPRLRPHSKSHKSTDIARLQMAGGAVGVCCQKVSEAEALVDGGVADILICNEVVGAAKIARLVALAKRARVAVCADHAANVAALDAAALAAGVVLSVLIEVDVGAARCGIAPGAPALALAKAVAAAPGLSFAGLHAYQGSAQHLRGVVERRAAITAATEKARVTRDLITAAGIACDTVTGAGTGSFMFERDSGVYTELQPGSYIFMDADYQKNAWEGFPAFGQSLHILATVMSAPAADRVVVDAGLKASSIDSGNPRVAGRPGLDYIKASDEHGVLSVAAGTTPPALGEKLLLVPGHCDPTVNMHDWFVCVRKGVVEALWPVTARGMMW